jgi:hypothetical protein
VFIASPAASQDGKALVAETRAPLAKRRNSKYQSWLCWRTNPATSDIQLKRSFQNAPWDYSGIGDFHRRDTRNRWEGSLEQQQCRTAVLNGIVNYAVGVAVALTLDFLAVNPATRGLHPP